MKNSIQYLSTLCITGAIVKLLISTKNGKNFTYLEVFIELFSSGFSGILTYHVCSHYSLSPHATASMVGMSGYCGVALINILKDIIKYNIKKI